MYMIINLLNNLYMACYGPTELEKNYLLIILAINLMDNQHLYKTNNREEICGITLNILDPWRQGRSPTSCEEQDPGRVGGFQWSNHGDPVP